MKRKNPRTKEDDYELIHNWAEQADLANYASDKIGSIENVGVATFQHLRMTFGINTIKPDLRVKQVLEREFGLGKLSDIDAILAAGEIAKVMGIQY